MCAALKGDWRRSTAMWCLTRGSRAREWSLLSLQYPSSANESVVVCLPENREPEGEEQRKFGSQILRSISYNGDRFTFSCHVGHFGVLNITTHGTYSTRESLSVDSAPLSRWPLWEKRMLVQWRRNEFESGSTDPARSAWKKICWSCPSTFLALKVQLVVLVSAFVVVSIQIGQFLVCCSSTHGAPRAQPFTKVRGHVPPMPHGVGAIVYTYSTLTDDVTNYVTHRIFNTNL